VVLVGEKLLVLNFLGSKTILSKLKDIISTSAVHEVNSALRIFAGHCFLTIFHKLGAAWTNFPSMN